MGKLSEMLQRIKEDIKYGMGLGGWPPSSGAKKVFTIILLSFVSFFGLHWSLDFFITHGWIGADVTALTFGVVKFSIGCICIWIADTVFLGDIDTVEEIRAGNTAYAIIYFAWAVIVAAILSSL